MMATLSTPSPVRTAPQGSRGACGWPVPASASTSSMPAGQGPGRDRVRLLQDRLPTVLRCELLHHLDVELPVRELRLVNDLGLGLPGMRRHLLPAGAIIWGWFSSHYLEKAHVTLNA
jgi:hypothetical protein